MQALPLPSAILSTDPPPSAHLDSRAPLQRVVGLPLFVSPASCNLRVAHEHRAIGVVIETGVKVQSQVIRITAEVNLEPECTEELMFSGVHSFSMVHFRIRIRMGFIRHESLYRQGICFGRKVHTINI